MVKGLFLAMLVCWIVAGVIGMKFHLTKYRKTSFLGGLTVMGFNWILMGISYYFDSYVYPIIAGFVITISAGAQFFVSFYTIISEVCGSTLYSQAIGAFLIANFCLLQIGPYIINDKGNFAPWSLFNGFLCLTCASIGYIYMIESQGLEKKDIYDLLRGRRTRNQL
jgi:hypothetical protein